DPHKYFQAGVMIFDIQKILKDQKEKELINHLGSFRYWFVDQDILNKDFYNYVHYLPMKWNVYHGNGNFMSIFPKLDSKIYSEYLAARKQPCILHFAGDQKPWINRKVDFFEVFYSNIKDTEW